LRENLITLIIKISKYNGVFNISSDSAISKYDFACHVAKIFAYDSTSIVKTKLYKLPHNAKRPKNMVLSNDKLKSTLDIRKIDILDDISVLLLQLKTQYYRDITTL
jgi:dTDP-4-dehydrorhamnose reductase